MALSVRLTTLVILLMITTSQGYVWIITDTKHPDLETHCYFAELKLPVPINETRQLPGRCETISCYDDYKMQGTGCGVIAAGPGYKVSETDYSKPYPDCCPTIVKDD